MYECNMCGMCKTNINSVVDIISYVKDTEEYIKNLNDEIKRLKIELEITKNEYNQRNYSLLGQKEFIKHIKEEIRDINFKKREFIYHVKVLNKLDEIELNINKNLNILYAQEDK